MEQLLHYVWKHKLFPLHPLRTTAGMDLEVIDTGLPNRNAGPDFFNAKIKMGDTVWVGNIEIHSKASDWFRHHHQNDRHYDNVILHVVAKADAEVTTASGNTLPQLVLAIPETVKNNYEQLLKTESYPPCYKIIPDLSRLTIHSWMSALQTERLEQKTDSIRRRVALCEGSWDAGYFVTLARNFGFGINGNAFEQWALNIPLHQVAHHRDNLFQIEAFFMGQAGLLDPLSIPERYREAAEREGYFTQLREEYIYLSHKFALKPIDYTLWRFLRLRPQNFPHIRIAQLANLYYHHQNGLGSLIESKDVKTVGKLLCTGVTPYWETHYVFGSAGTKHSKHLSAESINLLLINTAIPTLFAYGRYKQNEDLCSRAFEFLEQLKAENNHIVRMWKDCGLTVETAGDSQALIQLKTQYCDKKECLRCRIGYHYLKQQPCLDPPPDSRQ